LYRPVIYGIFIQWTQQGDFNIVYKDEEPKKKKGDEEEEDDEEEVSIIAQQLFNCLCFCI
jgi:hypothetical protein